MKHFSIPALTLSILTFFVTPALADFVGPYQVGNWTQTLDGGSINLLGAPSSITMVSSNMWNGTTDQDFTISAVSGGLVSFDWDFTTTDWSALYDPFGYLLNGVFHQLTNDNGGNQSGSASFSVAGGDTFGFRAHSLDSIYGSGVTVISNFSGPEYVANNNVVPTPEPSTMILLGSGLVGLIGYRVKKQG